MLSEVVSEIYANGEEILPFMYIILVCFYNSTYILYFGSYMLWDKICCFVNILCKYVEVEFQFEAIEFLQQWAIIDQ